MPARDEYARILARQVLELDREPFDPLPAELGQAEVRVDLRAMVHGITRRIFVSQAQVAEQVERKLREAMTPDAIDVAIADAVASELSRIKLEIGRIVRDKVERAIDRAVEERVGNGPKVLAKKIVDKMWASLTDVKRHPSNIYGSRSAPRSKKR